MSVLFSSFLSAIVALSFTQSAAAQNPTRYEFAPVNHVFAPNGFDDNDTSEIVVTGYLPSPCYERPDARVRVGDNTIQVRVTTARKPQSDSRKPLCPDVVVPFTETVKVGYLATGNYKIVVNENSNAMRTGSMKVIPSTISAVDEHPYALVQYVEQDPKNMKYYLNGSIYSDCYQLDSIQYETNNKDVVAVLPTMKRVGNQCATRITPFRVQINPPLNTLSSPYFLLHVRSADGKSVNFVGSKK